MQRARERVSTLIILIVYSIIPIQQAAGSSTRITCSRWERYNLVCIASSPMPLLLLPYGRARLYLPLIVTLFVALCVVACCWAELKLGWNACRANENEGQLTARSTTENERDNENKSVFGAECRVPSAECGNSFRLWFFRFRVCDELSRAKCQDFFSFRLHSFFFFKISRFDEFAFEYIYFRSSHITLTLKILYSLLLSVDSITTQYLRKNTILSE